MDTFGTYKHAVAGELQTAADVIDLTFERFKKNPDKNPDTKKEKSPASL